MSNEVGRVSLGLDLNSKSFTGQVSSVANKAKSMLAAALSVKAVVDFGKKCIELGSDLAEVQNVVDVTFTSMSSKVNEFAQSAAANYGLSETMAKKYVGTFGSMADAFGFTEAQAYEMSTTLTGLAGDVASFYNMTQDEAYGKLKSVFTGESEALKELGVVMTQTALDAYALANGFGKTTAAMTEAEKVSLRYAFVQDQLANATGDFLRTSDGWANQSKLLSLQAESAMAAVGQGLINLLTPALRVVNAVMAKVVSLANAFSALTEAFTGKSSSGNAASSVAASASAAESDLSSAAESAKAIQNSLAGFDQITKLSDTASSGASGGGTSVSNPVIEEAAAATQANDELSESAKKLKAWLDALDLSRLQQSWDKFKGSVSGLADVLRGAMKWALENVLAPLAEWTIEKAAPALLETLASAFNLISAVLKKLKPIWDWIWKHMLRPIAQFAADSFVRQVESIGKAFDAVASIISGDTDLIQEMERWLGDVFGEEYVASIRTYWSDTRESISRKWNELLSNVKDRQVAITATISTTWASLKSHWESLMANFKDRTCTISLKFSAAASDLKNWINTNVIDKINNKLSTVPVLKNVKIPHLAQGGYVKANTPQLAVIGDNRHQGEIVAPEDKLRQMAREAAGSMDPQAIALLTQILTCLQQMPVVKLDPDSMTRYFIQYIQRSAREGRDLLGSYL